MCKELSGECLSRGQDIEVCHWYVFGAKTRVSFSSKSSDRNSKKDQKNHDLLFRLLSLCPKLDALWRGDLLEITAKWFSLVTFHFFLALKVSVIEATTERLFFSIFFFLSYIPFNLPIHPSPSLSQKCAYWLLAWVFLNSVFLAFCMQPPLPMSISSSHHPLSCSWSIVLHNQGMIILTSVA